MISAHCLLFTVLVGIGLPANSDHARPTSSKKKPDVTVTRENYEGWTDAIRVSNGLVDLVVVPQIGRVMRFGYVNGANLLWENPDLAGKAPDPNAKGFQNFGGDKVWVSPQAYWNWPPDLEIDPGSYSAELISNGVRLVGKGSTRSKVRMVREIRLDAELPEVTLQNEMFNLGESRPIGVWENTQVDDPSLVILPTKGSPYQSKGWFDFGQGPLRAPFHEIHGDTLWLRRSPDFSRKFGSTTPDGDLVAIVHDKKFHVSQRTANHAIYPDQDSAQQVYLSADPTKYVELEQLSPMRHRESNEVVMLTVQWKIER